MQKTRRTHSSRMNLAKKLRSVQVEKNRIFISASIVSVLVLATLANTNIFSFNNSAPQDFAQYNSANTGRFIASVDKPVNQRIQYDKEILALTKSKINRETASFGKKPSLQDKLKYEVLEGKYLMQFEKGKIKSIEFTRIQKSSGEPKYVNNRKEFLSEHKSLFPVNFDVAQQASVQKSRLKTVESFNLMDGLNKVANVEFQLDVYGRFISMKVN
jgi:hypothetical protein